MSTNEAAPSPALAAPSVAVDAKRLVPFEDLVGRQEIAAKLGLSVTAIDTWRRRYPTFPVPVATISGTPVWRWRDVLLWTERTPRRRGRPRKAPSA